MAKPSSESVMPLLVFITLMDSLDESRFYMFHAIGRKAISYKYRSANDESGNP